MKKSFIYSLAAVFALAACTKEADVKVPTGETVTIIASVDQTKSTEDHASFSWATDEQISVGTSDDEYVAFEVTDAANGLFSHTFTGETPSLLVAVSPVQANADFAGADAYEVELPAIYNDYEPSKGVTNALMIGVPDPNTPNRFLFRHAAALLKITYANVPVGTAGFVLKADKPINNGWSGDKVLLGGTSVSDIEIDNTNSALVQENPTIINLKEAVTEANTTLTFYVPVPTGEYSMLQVSLTGNDQEYAIKTMDRTGKTPLTLARGDVFSFPTITLDPAPEEKYYEKVTSLDEIVDGAQYVIGAWFNDDNGDAFYAIPANPTLSNGKIVGEEVAVSSEGIALSDADGFVWTLSKSNNFWTLMDGSKYLYHSNGGNSGTNLGYGSSASYLWSITEWEENTCGLFKFAGVNEGSVKGRGLLFSESSSSFGGYALSNYGSNYSGIDLYVLVGSDDREDVTLSFETPSYELSLGTDDYTNFTGQVVTTTPTGVSGVKYTLTGDSLGSIDEDSGVITLDGETAGTATVTATFAGNANYKPAASVSYTIIVNDPSVVDYVTLDWTYPNEGEAATSAGISAIPGVTAEGLGSDYAAGNSPYCIKFDTTGDYIQIKTDSAIGEVSVMYKMLGGENTSNLTISESSDGGTWTEVEVLTISGAQNSEGTLTTTESFSAESRFVKMVFTKGSNVGIGGITVLKADATPRFTVESPLAAAAAANEYTVNITRKFFTGAINVSLPSGCDWIQADNVAANANSFNVRVSTNTGESRTATLTLSADGVDSQELVVNQDGSVPGTEANPYSVAQALALIETLGGSSSSTVWVTGTVSKVETFFSNYHSITYFISDDGTNTNPLEVYSGKGLDGAYFSDITDLAVGDKVVVKGNLKDYNGTSEFTQNSIITSFISKAPRYTVTLGSVTPTNSGTIAASATSVGAQGVVTLTATPAAGYQFDKWTVTDLSTNQAISVTDDQFVMPASNVSVTATFIVAEGEIEETISGTFTKDSNGDLVLTTNSGITITQAKGTSNTAPNESYNSATTLRIYVGNTLTFSGKTITSIVLTHSSSNNGGSNTSSNVGTYTRGSTSSTWDGESSSVVITNIKGSESNNIQLRPTKIVVTYKNN